MVHLRNTRPMLSAVTVMAFLAANVPAQSFADLKFSATDFITGSTDVNQQFMGGTETDYILAHKGKLYAGMGFWTDVPGNDPSSGSQILIKKAYSQGWQLEKAFSNDYIRPFLYSIAVTVDGKGNAVNPPDTILMESSQDVSPPRNTTVWTHNDATGAWTSTLVIADMQKAYMRCIAFHVDRVTGIGYVFGGSADGGVYKGVYDATVAGRLVWNSSGEWSGGRRVMAMCEANGVLYAGNGPAEDGSEPGGLFRRNDGANPTWDLVSEIPLETRGNSNLRGLTPVPDPKGGNYDVIVGCLEASGRMVRFDPHNNHAQTLELDYAKYYSDLWKQQIGGARIGAYNRLEEAIHPVTKEKVHLIGLWVNNPNRGIPPNNGSHYLVRHLDASYEFGSAYDSNNPVPGGQELRGTRTIQQSPFVQDEGRVLYFGGYDCAGNDSHNTAWIYKATLTGSTGVVKGMNDAAQNLRMDPASLPARLLPGSKDVTIELYAVNGVRILTLAGLDRVRNVVLTGVYEEHTIWGTYIYKLCVDGVRSSGSFVVAR